MQLQIDAHDVGYDTRMLQLLEWSPLIIFYATFKLVDLYWATAALMISLTALALIHRLRTGKFKTMHLITAAVALLLGAATLLLHDKRFIEWKPTVLLSISAAAFLGSMFVGSQPLARRLLESVFDQPPAVSERIWSAINLLWIVFFTVLALVNIYVARNFSESAWVNFKFYGLPGSFFVFMFPQALWLSTKMKPAAAEQA
jgi:intracellular septation protein